MNNCKQSFKRGFEYKPIKEYVYLKEWLDNAAIAMNENAALRKPGGNYACIIDKRMGAYFSLMSLYITTDKQKELMDNEDVCMEFLAEYYFKHKQSYFV